DKLRRRKTRQRMHSFLTWIKEEKTEEAFYHPGITLDNKEKAAVLFKEVSALPEKQRIAFTLIKIQGMSYNEVCTIMNQGTKAIESLVSMAKQNLQKQLE